MRHRHGYRKLNRPSDHRRAMLRNLATSLFKHESIETTLERAKELRSIVEKIVTLGKRGDLHARRQAAQYLFEGEVVAKVFGGLAQRFKERQGGYLRILRLGHRLGDQSRMAAIQFVDYEPKGAATHVEEKKAKKDVAPKAPKKAEKPSKEAKVKVKAPKEANEPKAKKPKK